MKKNILALALACLMVAFTLISCGVNSEEVNLQILGEAEQALKNQGYSIATQISYTASAEELQGAIGRIQNASTLVNVLGDAFAVESSTTMDGISVSRGYYVTEDMLYAHNVFVTEDTPTNILKKAELNEDLKAQLAANTNLGFGLDYTDFETHEGKGDLDKCTITCTTLKAETLATVDETLSTTLKAAGYEVTLKGATLTIEIAGGQFNTVTIVYDYSVLSETGDMYNMTATLTSKVTVYTGAITPPFEADDYHLVSYENALK